MPDTTPAPRRLAECPIAVVGMAALFPGAPDLEQYWQNILNKVDSIIEVPESRWDIADYYDEDSSAPDKTYSKRGGFLPEVDFDPMEFGIPPNLLEQTDSSQLLGLLVARTASLSGTIQVVARSVETALHKMHEIGFDLDRLVSGYGVAPLPPVAADDLVGIGRTNDAVLYGAEVTLWVTGDDSSLEESGPRIPSCSSPAFGQPFADIFEHHNRDFYKIDPLLFSPATVTLNNLDSGRQFRFGETRPDVLRTSFYGP